MNISLSKGVPVLPSQDDGIILSGNSLAIQVSDTVYIDNHHQEEELLKGQQIIKHMGRKKDFWWKIRGFKRESGGIIDNQYRDNIGPF